MRTSRCLVSFIPTSGNICFIRKISNLFLGQDLWKVNICVRSVLVDSVQTINIGLNCHIEDRNWTKALRNFNLLRYESRETSIDVLTSSVNLFAAIHSLHWNWKHFWIYLISFRHKTEFSLSYTISDKFCHLFFW